MKLQPAELKTPEALDDVFTELAAQRPDTLQIMSDSGIFDLSDRIAALAQMHRIPSFATLPEFVGVGGLLAYGASRRRLFIRSGYYIKRILQGRNPVTCPANSLRVSSYRSTLGPQKYSIWWFRRDCSPKRMK
jgi:putative ABC transport system substrate-binding protein